MAKKPIPTPERVRQLLRYDPVTGKLFWRPRPLSAFTDGGHTAAHTCAKWNARWADKEAFTARNRGYFVGAVDGVNLPAHRVAWAIYRGSWPSQFIDHINGNPSDNRIENLRDVSHSDNHRNSSRRSDNTSGVTGVYWATSKQKWAAYIRADKTLALGRFDTFAEAVAARKAAEKVLGYHANHGRTNPSGGSAR